MIQIFDNVLKRNNVKIGWIDGSHIHDYTGKDLGYFGDNKIWDLSGKRIAFIEGEYIYLTGSSNKIRLEDKLKDVIGGNVSDLCRVAITFFLG